MGVVRVARDAQFAAGYARWYAGTWKVPLALVAAGLFAFWPLLAFQRHWTSLVRVPCWQDPSGDSCTMDGAGNWDGSWVKAAGHSAPSATGVWVTAAWLGFLAACVAAVYAAGRVSARRARVRLEWAERADRIMAEFGL